MHFASLTRKITPWQLVRSLLLTGGLSLAGLSQAGETPPVAQAPVQAKLLMRTQNSWDGSPLQFEEGQGEVSAVYIEIAPGAQTGWHHHPVPNFAYLMEGELEVQLKDGRSNRIKAGEALAEVVHVLHNGHNPSASQPAKLVVFYIGNPGLPLTVMAPSQDQ